ncbi:furin-like protease isoform 1-CRR isoform X1 [Brachionus plicatilis]|uniref:Furin-like protease isoform 1-CRR isoform X1 n=1 Tax=Brachionus plicatilis TaxID=10195 RepID=A0A3M7PAT9_BRAPC|nr:furin-like protease isoform 1-CRR isoform X1 [Brachionus plicatilis]
MPRLVIIFFLAISSLNCLEIVLKLNQILTDDLVQNFYSKYNLKFKRLLFEDYYVFDHDEPQRSRRSSDYITILNKKLTNDSVIKWFQIQKNLKRVKRDFFDLFQPGQEENEMILSDHFEIPFLKYENLKNIFNHQNKDDQFLNKILMCELGSVDFNDPQWSLQWYINDGCEQGFHLNITKAWSLGYTGKGVVLSIIDDGLERKNFELAENYDALASYDLNDDDSDPEPRYESSNENKHGTRCAGEIAAKSNNSFCGVGVAYDSRIGGIRLLDGKITDRLEAEALAFNINYIDIFSASWGPLDDGKTVDGPGVLSRRAFKNGIRYGRAGKGTVYVWAAGNGGRLDDNCNCDGYTSSIYTITIGSINQDGEMSVFSEKCSSILASTFSSGKVHQNGIITSDLHNRCTRRHTGTSASAPIGAGIIALALEANRNLTWRDVQYLIVLTSKPYKLASDDWTKNGIGRFVSHKFGYGLMNAGNMVEMALKWPNVGQQLKCVSLKLDLSKIPKKSVQLFSLEYSKCKNINYIEHVLARLTLSSGVRGKLKINLISPTGTRSNLLDFRKHDFSHYGFKSWPFMSVHYWGEKPDGLWYLEILNKSNFDAFLDEWKLVIYGVEYVPRLFFE